LALFTRVQDKADTLMLLLFIFLKTRMPELKM